MIYNAHGLEISKAYGKNGTELSQAYGKNGNELIIDNSLTVMTFNVQWYSGLNANQTMQSELIETYNPDLIGFQEFTSGTSFPQIATATLAEYPEKHLSSQAYKNGIASKKVLSNVTSGDFTAQASEIRGYQKAYFTMNGKTICWVNTHLETSSHESVKVAQAEEICNLVKNEPYFIVTGDFNTVCKSTSDTEYTTIMKQFLDIGCHSANCSEQHGFLNTWTDSTTGTGTWYPCDHIITSNNISIEQVIIDNVKLNYLDGTNAIDHLAVISTLVIN